MLSHVTSHLTLLSSISERGPDTVSLKHTPTYPVKRSIKPNFFAETSVSRKQNSSVPLSTLKSLSVTSFNLLLPPATYLCQNWRCPQSESVIVWITSSLLGVSQSPLEGLKNLFSRMCFHIICGTVFSILLAALWPWGGLSL
jgi:hypothetical protein